MAPTGSVPNARELILELVELQDRIDEVRTAERGVDTEPLVAAGPPELVELVEREEEVIAELRDYRETYLKDPSPQSP
jgi:hypothetical protein